MPDWPDRSLINSISNQDWSKITIPEPQFQAWHRWTRADLSFLTGRELAWFEKIMQQDEMSREWIVTEEVFIFMMEQKNVQRREDIMDTEYDTSITSMSVTGYSEQKPQMRERNPLFAKMANTSWDIANKLWFLMTQEIKDEINSSAGIIVPAEAVTEVNWFSYPQPPAASGLPDSVWWKVQA